MYTSPLRPVLTRTVPLRRPKLTVDAFVQRDDTIRLGWDPDRSFVLTPPPGVRPDVLLDILRRMDGVVSRAHLIWYAGTVGLAANVMSTVLSELDEFGLLVECVVPGETANSGRPYRAPIHIIGRGQLTDGVHSGLSTSSRIRVQRSGEPPRRLLQHEEGNWRCALAILTDAVVPDPRVVAALVVTRTPHLLVRLRQGVGVVGPLVLPGVSSCLRCLELFRSAMDPRWPHVSAQLLGRVGEAPRPAALATTAVALAQVDAFTRGLPPSLVDTTLEIDLSTNRMTTRRWSRQPECDCSRV